MFQKTSFVSVSVDECGWPDWPFPSRSICENSCCGDLERIGLVLALCMGAARAAALLP